MDHVACNVVYVDRRSAALTGDYDEGTNSALGADRSRQEFEDNVKLLKENFGHVHICDTGSSCISAIQQADDDSTTLTAPLLVLIGVSQQVPRHSEPSTAEPNTTFETASSRDGPSSEVYGTEILEQVVAEVESRGLADLVLPIAVVGEQIHTRPSDEHNTQSTPKARAKRRELVETCLELGAIDALTGPFDAKTVDSLEVHAHMARKRTLRTKEMIHQEQKEAGRSWLGPDNAKPFAYLREAMVADLMRDICQGDVEGDDVSTTNTEIIVSPARQADINAAVGKWSFDAHSFSEDELLMAGVAIFKHALTMPALEAWRIPDHQMIRFVVACRAAYNEFVPYHNFRHVIDVLQATFHFLLHMRALPAYEHGDGQSQAQHSPLESLIGPAEALTLLITAIGHDVGHPGVNNGFLVTLNAPLAQLYNDKSVLEAFHCAAYSQILRRHWPAAFGNKAMRSLLISTILATDMAVHAEYVRRMMDLRNTLQVENSMQGWAASKVAEHKTLACALLMKCADISNVTRNKNVALKWMEILGDEFMRQCDMEKELQIPTSLYAPPMKERTAQFKSQLNFISMFALPLFEGVAELMPSLQYVMDELELNHDAFIAMADEADDKMTPDKRVRRDGAASPKALAAARAAVKNTAAPLKTPEIKPTAETASPSQANSAAQTPETISPRTVSSTDIQPEDIKSTSKHHHQQSSTATGGNSSHTGTITTTTAAEYASSSNTGKLPLSPSTKGTSVMSSRDSLDRPTSKPLSQVTVPDATKSTTLLTSTSSSRYDGDSVLLQSEGEHESMSTSTLVPPGGKEKGLRKKTSRFRLKALDFFRKNKSSAGSGQEI